VATRAPGLVLTPKVFPGPPELDVTDMALGDLEAAGDRGLGFPTPKRRIYFPNQLTQWMLLADAKTDRRPML